MAEPKKTEEGFTPEAKPVSDGTKVEEPKVEEPKVEKKKAEPVQNVPVVEPDPDNEVSLERKQHIVVTELGKMEPALRKSYLDAVKSTAGWKKVKVPKSQQIRFAIQDRQEVDEATEKAVTVNRNMQAKMLTGMDFDDIRQTLLKMEYTGDPVSDAALEAAKAADPQFIKRKEDYSTIYHNILTNSLAGIGAIADGIAGSQGKYKAKEGATAKVISAGTEYTMLKKDEREKLNQNIDEKNVEIYNTYKNNITKQAAVYAKAFNELEKAHIVQRTSTINNFKDIYKSRMSDQSKERTKAAELEVDLIKQQREDLQKIDTANLGAAKAQLQADVQGEQQKLSANIANSKGEYKAASDKRRAKLMAIKEEINYNNQQAALAKAQGKQRLAMSNADKFAYSGMDAFVNDNSYLQSMSQKILDDVSDIPDSTFSRLSAAASKQGRNMAIAINETFGGGSLFYEPDGVKKVMQAVTVLGGNNMTPSVELITKLDEWDVDDIKVSLTTFNQDFKEDFAGIVQGLQDSNARLTGDGVDKIVILANYSTALNSVLSDIYSRNGKRKLSPEDQKKVNRILHSQRLINNKIGTDAVIDLKDQQAFSSMVAFSANKNMSSMVYNDIDGAGSMQDELMGTRDGSVKDFVPTGSTARTVAKATAAIPAIAPLATAVNLVQDLVGDEEEEDLTLNQKLQKQAAEKAEGTNQ